jgi:hypothetical protein
MTPMKYRLKYRCWRRVEGEWELAGYEAVMAGRWCISSTPDMANPTEGTFSDVERDHNTGRKDKNGREIYEGDIVTFQAPWMSDKRTGTVVWNARKLAYDVPQPNPYSPGKVRNFSLYNTKVEVIGNTYENPELLEAAK